MDLIKLTSRLKTRISKWITLPIIGKGIAQTYNAINYFGIQIKTYNPFLSYSNIAWIFWNKYESVEAWLIKQYLNHQYLVVELGSSLGIITSLIAQRTLERIICVKANQSRIGSIEWNLKDQNFTNYNIINVAISCRSVG